jgi:heterodisulfide reductase subunit C
MANHWLPAGGNPTNDDENLSRYSLKVIKNEFDRGFVDEIMAFGGGNVHACFQCGTCTSVCPVSLKVENKVRNIIKMCQMGLKERVLSTPWVCATCYRCYEYCPSVIDPTELIVALRHIMVRDLGPPRFVVAFSQSIADQGQMPLITSRIKRLREELGLHGESIDERFRGKVVREIRTIMEATGFDKLIGIKLGD